MKKKFWFLILAVLLLASVTACGKDETDDTETEEEYDDGITNVAFSLPPVRNAWETNFSFVLEKITEGEPTINAVIRQSTDAADQLAALQSFRADDSYDMIMIMPMEDEAIYEEITSIYEAGIPIFIIGSVFDPDACTASIVMDEQGSGVAAGEYARDFFKNESLVNYVILRSEVGTDTDTARYTGITETLIKDPRFTLLGEADGLHNSNSGFEEMNSLLKQFPKIDYVCVQDDDTLNGAMNAILQAGRTDIRLITGIGGNVTSMNEIFSDSSIHKMSSAMLPTDMVHTIIDTVNSFMLIGSVDQEILSPSYAISSDNAESLLQYAYE